MSDVAELSDFRFAHRMRVRWVEVDMQRIVFNAHYLTYIDTAVADYWRALGMPYESAMPIIGGDLYVKKASLTYHASARYDDVLDVALRCARMGNSSMVFEGAIFHGGKLLISAELVYVFADPHAQTPKPIPTLLREWLQGFEAGQPMCSTQIEIWRDCKHAAIGLRSAVFSAELGIDASLMSDTHDLEAIHAATRNRMGDVVASGRAYADCDNTWRIGRMAVNRALRGSHLGAAVLSSLEAAIADRRSGDSTVVIELDAMVSAEPFYSRAGYVRCAEPINAMNIPHVMMKKTLPP